MSIISRQLSFNILLNLFICRIYQILSKSKYISIKYLNYFFYINKIIEHYTYSPRKTRTLPRIIDYNHSHWSNENKSLK